MSLFCPADNERGERWRQAVRSLKGQPAFRVLLDSVKDLQDRLDETNRIVGQENKVSGAFVLAELRKDVTACWESRADRDSNEGQDSEG